MNRTICATDWEVKALLAGRLTTLWRPVPGGGVFKRSGGDWYWEVVRRARTYHGVVPNKTAAYSAMAELSPYGQPGDMLAVKECWRPWYRTGGRCTHGAEGILYRADESSVEMRLPLGCWQFRRARDWRSPATMPRWAVRPGFIRPITGVQVKRVQSMTPRDVTAAGIPRYMMRFDGVAWDPMQAIQDRWDSRYANTPYAWSANPPAWGITVGGNDDR